MKTTCVFFLVVQDRGVLEGAKGTHCLANMSPPPKKKKKNLIRALLLPFLLQPSSPFSPPLPLLSLILPLLPLPSLWDFKRTLLLPGLNILFLFIP